MPEVSSPPTSTQLNTTTTAAVPLLTPPSNEPNANHVCFGCGLPIIDRHFYATLPDIKWHESCLRCAKCDCRLKENSTCFIKNGKAYCKEDYSLLFPIIKCAKCQLQIKRSDLVFKMATGNNSQPKVFHLNCFSCQVCSRQFQTGDEYQMIDDYVYCKEDGQMVLQQTGGGYTATIVNTPTNHHQQSSSQTSTSIYSSNSQLYMNLMNNNSSTVSLTPENSIQSSSSSSSSFSPNTNSSSSSIVDSPSNTSSYLPPIYSQSNSSFTYGSGYPMMAHPQQVHPQMMPPVYSNLQASNHGFMTASVDGNNNSTAKDEPKNEVTNEEESGINRRGMESDEDEIDDSDGEDSDSGSAAEGEEMDETTSSSLNESLNHHKSAKKGQNSYPKPMMNSAKMTSQRPQHQPQYPQLHHPNHHHHLLQIKSGHHHSKPARIRTVLNERQLGMLRECYRNNPRPDALMKEQLVEITGLNPRVIRVWFQNKRCKDKKKNMLAPATNTTPNQPGQLPQLTQQMNIRNTNLMPEPTSYNQGMVYNSNHPNYDY